MLPACAAELHVQGVEAAPQVRAHLGLHELPCVGEEGRDARLPLEPGSHGRIEPAQARELRQATGVGQGAAVEGEAAAVSAGILGQAALVAEAPHAHGEARAAHRYGRGAQRFARDDALEGRPHLGQLQGQEARLEQALHVAHRVRDARHELRLAPIEPEVAIRAHALHDPEEHEAAVARQELLAIQRQVLAQRVEVVLEQGGARLRRQRGLALVEQLGHVVLQRPAQAALVVDEPGLAIAHHHVPRLQVAVDEVLPARLPEPGDVALEVLLQARLVEGDVCELEEVVLEVVQVPLDRLGVERGARIRHAVVHRRAALDLEARQPGQHALVDRAQRGRQRAVAPGAGLGERVVERRVPQVLEQVDARVLVRGVDLRHRQPEFAERLRVREERAVLVRVRSDHGDRRAPRRVREADHATPGAVAREGFLRGGRHVERPQEESVDGVLHGGPMIRASSPRREHGLPRR